MRKGKISLLTRVLPVCDDVRQDSDILTHLAQARVLEARLCWLPNRVRRGKMGEARRFTVQQFA